MTIQEFELKSGAKNQVEKPQKRDKETHRSEASGSLEQALTTEVTTAQAVDVSGPKRTSVSNEGSESFSAFKSGLVDSQ